MEALHELNVRSTRDCNVTGAPPILYFQELCRFKEYDEINCAKLYTVFSTPLFAYRIK